MLTMPTCPYCKTNKRVVKEDDAIYVCEACGASCQACGKDEQHWHWTCQQCGCSVEAGQLKGMFVPHLCSECLKKETEKAGTCSLCGQPRNLCCCQNIHSGFFCQSISADRVWYVSRNMQIGRKKFDINICILWKTGYSIGNKEKKENITQSSLAPLCVAQAHWGVSFCLRII